MQPNILECGGLPPLLRRKQPRGSIFPRRMWPRLPESRGTYNLKLMAGNLFPDWSYFIIATRLCRRLRFPTLEGIGSPPSSNSSFLSRDRSSRSISTNSNAIACGRAPRTMAWARMLRTPWEIFSVNSEPGARCRSAAHVQFRDRQADVVAQVGGHGSNGPRQFQPCIPPLPGYRSIVLRIDRLHHQFLPVQSTRRYLFHRQRWLDFLQRLRRRNPQLRRIRPPPHLLGLQDVL